MAKRWVLHFDGGSRGNPGPAFGSFVLLEDGRERRRRRLEFGRRTNNEAEYLALIGGLQDALAYLTHHGIDAAKETLEVRGDSQLVLSQVRGTWKVREPRMGALRDQALKLLGRFGHYTLVQVPRAKSVELLGH